MSTGTDRFTKTRDAARGRWKGILMHFGIDEAFLKNEHGPCPICNGKDRFRWDDEGGDGGFYCNQCGPGSGMKLLMEAKAWTFQRAAKEIDEVVGNFPIERPRPQAPTEDKTDLLRRLWHEAKPLTYGDPAWRYLESRCGSPEGLTDDLRFHPALKHPEGGTHPGLLARMVDLTGPRVVGLHRTFLTPDGRKAALNPVRMSLGEMAVVRLGGVQERLGIAEGIETAICAGKSFQVPCWAALCANGVKVWTPPPEVRSVVVFGDNDVNYTGQEAAYALAHRLSRLGLHVEVLIPAEVGTDWADTRMEGTA